MMKLFKLHGEYIDYLFGYHGNTFCAVMSVFSAVSICVVMTATWIAFLTGEISFFTAIYAPIVFPLPIHLLHIALFAAWAIKQKDSNQ